MAGKAFVPGIMFGDCSMVVLGAGAFSSAIVVFPSADSNMLDARFRNGTQSLWSFAIGGLRSFTSKR